MKPNQNFGENLIKQILCRIIEKNGFQPTESQIIGLIKRSLSDKLRKKKYQGNKNRMAGHCYIASEAFYHLTKQTNLYTPSYVKFCGETHWFLSKKDGTDIDITVKQFGGKIPPYHLKKNCGFLTKNPSKRAVELLKVMFDKLQIEKSKR
ncbi:MAG TPA: hypothetical protein PLP33_07015 [Leptospiraceae bacterium]|nr:hypothetical protein [Leptospiraceae bacterium]